MGNDYIGIRRLNVIRLAENSVFYRLPDAVLNKRVSQIMERVPVEKKDSCVIESSGEKPVCGS